MPPRGDLLFLPHRYIVKMLQLGRGLFVILVLGLIMLVPVTLGHLPPVVASHFDGAGVPNGWSSRPTYALLLIAVGALLPLGTIGLVSLLVRRGPQLLNIPARDYWQRPEHGPEAVRRVRAYIWWLGCVMTATALGVHLLILKAHASQPPRLSTRGILVVLGGVLLGIGLWIGGWYRPIRPPVPD
jgi:uncharacterized membrane protein